MEAGNLNGDPSVVQLGLRVFYIRKEPLVGTGGAEFLNSIWSAKAAIHLIIEMQAVSEMLIQ